MITFKETFDLNKIRFLHEKIFLEKFPEDEFQSKNKTKNLKIYTFYKKNICIGYTIIFDKLESLSYHLWIGGICPEFQNKGYYFEILNIFEEIITKKGYKKITVSSYNHRPNMIRLLVKKGYKIIGTSSGKHGDTIKINFEYIIKNDKEIRISLTNNCNFKCIFCHNEGVDFSKFVSLSEESLKKILFQAYLNGFRKITFTGGEPLLNKKSLYSGMEYCNTFLEKPELKIITNGFFVDLEFIKKLKSYKGEISLNLSIHSLNSDEFDYITGTKNNIETIFEKIKLLKQYEIKFRINCVFGYFQQNQSLDKKIKDFVDSCLLKGIEKVTFLELLTPKDNIKLSDVYLSFEKINELLEKNINKIELIKKSSKKISYLLKEENKKLEVNIFRLTCKRGCEVCASEKDKTIGPDGKYYPCMFFSEMSSGSVLSNMEETLKKGEEIIIINQKKLELKEKFL
ncbi:MAG: radical SAM protein [Cetobacterium sp.]